MLRLVGDFIKYKSRVVTGEIRIIRHYGIMGF